jgi:TATA-box binding protein (TBP) (component of TFIID and TFIIIB)
MHAFAALVKSCAESVCLREVTVRNIVCSTRFAKQIDLPGFARQLGLSCAYDPELFPGLRITLTDPKVVVSVFGGGKAILAGARTLKDAARAWQLVAAGVEPHVTDGTRASLQHRRIAVTKQAFRSQAIVALTTKNSSNSCNPVD